MALKHVYLIKRGLSYIVPKTFSPIRCGTSQTPPPCKHNILVVSHGIVGPNKHPYGTKQTPHRGRGSTLIPFVRPAPNRVDIVRFRPKGALTALKRIYRVKRSPYLYSAKNFPPHPMWDVTNFLGHNII